LKLCNTHLAGKSLLAPMAGVADSTFRLICKKWGASFVFTELISANALVRNSEKTFRLMKFQKKERPIAIQLFGNNPEILAEAARIAETLKPEWIDLNFGCPAKRVVKNGAGSALLNDLHGLEAIVRAVRKSISLPVSAKIRSGWDSKHIVAVEAAKIIEAEGACAVTVHGRTRQMGFRCQADWTVIRDVKDAVSIPVIGNGDILSAEDGKRMIDETGCDFVMIGRGAYGRPWIFRQFEHFMETGKLIPEPSFSERIDHCIKHYRLALKIIDQERCVKEMRKHIGWYLKGMPGCAQVKQEVFRMTDPKAVLRRVRKFQKQLNESADQDKSEI
jgi:tRNA-dihydrouridine synthase B